MDTVCCRRARVASALSWPEAKTKGQKIHGHKISFNAGFLFWPQAKITAFGAGNMKFLNIS
jgi:hypothetical protein